MAKNRKRRGRPPLPEGAAKQGRLHCRLQQSEIEEVKAAAKVAELSNSEWIRQTLLAAARAGKKKG